MISRSMFAALADGGGGPRAIDWLKAEQRGRNLALMEGIARIAALRGHPAAELVRRSLHLLADLHTADPAAVRRILDWPWLTAWATRCFVSLRGEQPDPGAPPEWTAAVAAGAATLAGRPATVEFEWPPEPTLDLPGLGVLGPVAAGDSVRIEVTPRGATFRHSGGSAVLHPAEADRYWQPFVPLELRHRGKRLDLVLDPLNTTTVDIPGVHVYAASPDWEDNLRAGWHTAVEHHSSVAAEAAAAYRSLVGLRCPPGSHESCTFLALPGCFALSVPTDGTLVALALAHEIQHLKLNLLSSVVTLTSSSNSEQFYAGWRPDRRPAEALLHGAYAHLGVATFWHHQPRTDDAAGLRAAVEFVRWRNAAHDAYRVLLDRDALTDAGRVFATAGVRALDVLLRVPVSDEALREADRESAEHRSAHAAEVSPG